MQPFPTLTGILGRLHRPAVRDLAWVLCSPPLLARPGLRHPLRASAWWDEPQSLGDWLLDLERDDSPLGDWLAQAPVRRLGLYYERLWQFAVRAAPGVELLAANLPVREHGHTLGELDLLLRDRDGVHHLELAIKLYLGLPGTDDAQRWLGPGSADRLDLKLAHLDRHQLPLSSTPQGRRALGALGLAQAQPSLWLAGYLFFPWPEGCAAPSDANPRHLRGRWLPCSAWRRFAASVEHPGGWQPLPRHAWLAPARSGQAPWTARAMENWIDALPPGFSPQLLAALRADGDGGWTERERVFLVADGWPASAT